MGSTFTLTMPVTFCSAAGRLRSPLCALDPTSAVWKPGKHAVPSKRLLICFNVRIHRHERVLVCISPQGGMALAMATTSMAMIRGIAPGIGLREWEGNLSTACHGHGTSCTRRRWLHDRLSSYPPDMDAIHVSAIPRHEIACQSLALLSWDSLSPMSFAHVSTYLSPWNFPVHRLRYGDFHPLSFSKLHGEFARYYLNPVKG